MITHPTNEARWIAFLKQSRKSVDNYISITKPGIIMGNLITSIAGYCLGARNQFSLFTIFVTLFGISLVIAGGCIFNNVIDKDIDTIMERTCDRVIPTKAMSTKAALLYACVTTSLGLLLLYLNTNLLTLAIVLVGLFIYVVIYSLWLKRDSLLGPIIGAISGAAPPVGSYTAATNHFDLGAYLLFGILIFWQLAHSYSINIYRIKDYNAAKIRTLPSILGIKFTKWAILVSTLVYTGLIMATALMGFSYSLFFAISCIVGVSWLIVGIVGLRRHWSNKTWAYRMFLSSIASITLLSIILTLVATH